jgi:hypothetical protein
VVTRFDLLPACASAIYDHGLCSSRTGDGDCLQREDHITGICVSVAAIIKHLFIGPPIEVRSAVAGRRARGLAV